MSPEGVRAYAFPLGDSGGNPCHVVISEPGRTDAEMVRFARAQDCVSAFVCTRERDDATIHLRFFSPSGAEEAMCVHGTVAALAVLCAHEGLCGTIRAAFAHGIETCVIEKDRTGVTCWVAQPAATFREVAGVTADLLTLLGIPTTDAAAANAPLLIGTTTRAKVLLALPSAAAVDRLRPDADMLAHLLTSIDATGLYAYSRDESTTGRVTVSARHFPVGLGIYEDAATGTAASALAQRIALERPRTPGWFEIDVRQGIAMGSPCSFRAGALVSGEGALATRISGGARIVAASEPT